MICEKCKSDLGDFDVAHACFTGAVQHLPFPIVETCEKGERDTLQARVKELEAQRDELLKYVGDLVYSAHTQLSYSERNNGRELIAKIEAEKKL